MSEVSAKKTAGAFMAMSNGMGVAKDAGAEMALSLAGLSADLASFWNTSQDSAANALNAIYTGNAQALKQYGIVLSDTTLEQFALSQGINKTMSEMTQAEKVQLRYKYVMQATADAQGDFAKTSGSWANQTKILKEQLKQLTTILGSGLIKVLTPAIQLLNQLLSTVINVANGISASFSRVFGTEDKQFNIDTSKATANVEGTTEAVEELQKTLNLTSFDELNQIGDNSTSQAVEVPTFDFSMGEQEANQGPSLVDELKEQSSLLDGILQEIKAKYEAFKEGLPKIELQLDVGQVETGLGNLALTATNAFFNILDAAAKFGADLLNSMDLTAISTNFITTFTNIASTFGTIITTIIELANKIATDIQLGVLIEKVSAVIAAFSGFVDKLVSAVAPAVKTFYDTAISPLVKWVGEKLVDALDFASGLLDDWGQWFSDNAPLIEEFAAILGETVANIWAMIEPIADAAWSFFKDTLTLLSEAIQASLGWVLEHGEVVASILAAVLAGIVAYKVVTAISAIITGFTATIEGLSAAFVAISANPVGLVVAAIAGLIVLFTSLWQNCEGFRNFWIGLWEKITEAVSNAWDKIKSIVDSIKSAIDSVKEGVSNFVGGAVDKVKGWFGLSVENATDRPAIAPVPVPALASGGVLTQSAIVQAGEYTGARNNPEIVTPESLMRQVFQESNAEGFSLVLGAISELTQTVKDKDTDVYLDRTKVTRSITKEQDKQKSNRGQTLVKREG